MDADSVRRKWEEDYPGVTDDGHAVPLSEVVPGAIVQGSPVGYMKISGGLTAGDPWKWKWVNLGHNYGN